MPEGTDDLQERDPPATLQANQQMDIAKGDESETFSSRSRYKIMAANLT